MNAEQIEWPEIKTFLFSANTMPARSHYKFTMREGRVFPTTRAQAQYFIKCHCRFDALNIDVVEHIEKLLNKYDLKGEYKYTKSKRWVRLINVWQLYDCLRKEYNL
ncbi:MAG: hypothetical protein IKM47_06490 [Bacteroidaceae bacterium]|nr:hypothetical protein [Bacteroidaceae bacterium]